MPLTARSFLLLFLPVLLWPSWAAAKVQIPSGLTASDREQVVRLLGFASSAKILSDPYPLGGYKGLEIGIAAENLPVEELARLGSCPTGSPPTPGPCLTAPQNDIAYPRFSLGKGLYKNIDFFVQFTPYGQQTEISQYGGLLRWSFYQGRFFPFSLSLLAHANSTNFSNVLATSSAGLDLIAGLNVENVSLYVGGGPLESRGRFIGGVTGITDTNRTEIQRAGGFHTVAGANVHASPLVFTFQIDRYTTTVYSGKLGLRF